MFFKNILARILKHNLDFFQDYFQDYFANILKNNLETVLKKIFKRKLNLEKFQDWAVRGRRNGGSVKLSTPNPFH